ncbi:hypothetical protein GCM10007216_39380 [Thalassobacillus devorans]|uniref:Spo0E like sporulation regulatory protein n=1 Tax=Thalassobacillus devorans TaxID=279813 RepID=A0ABQ1PVP6_9BACI|nr:hypothetical protein [Thalassobacillus devorans]NIK30863.1 hypothetical protein [Thalassobacillus devorans]GGD04859.1 hypothetical protein GCM10007216_39380 [Thalassobacillus devorans]
MSENLNHQEARLAFRKLQESVAYTHMNICYWKQILIENKGMKCRLDLEEAERSTEQLIGQLRQIELNYLTDET